MKRRNLAISLILFLTACNLSVPAEQQPKRQNGAPENTAIPAKEDTFIFRLQATDILPEKRLNGYFKVENACLIFVDALDSYTAALKPDWQLDREQTAVVLPSNKKISLGTVAFFGGGIIDISGQTIPQRCPQSVIAMGEE